MRQMSRRSLFAGASALGAAAGLAACGGNAGSGNTQVRYGHWDNGNAQATFQKLFQQFMEQNDEVDVAVEFASYDDFQERMTTQIAGKNVADVFWVASPQVMTYEANGLYRDIADIPGFDLGQYDEDLLERIRIDGNLNTMPMGMSIPAIRWNATYAEEDGIEFPTNTTWDDLGEFLIDYSKDARDERKGLFYQPDTDLSFEAWTRQRGEDLWTEDGKLGASIDTIAAWLNWWEKLRNAGATLSLDEQGSVAPSWNEHGSKVLASFVNQNHILEAAQVFPDHRFRQSVVPVTEGAASGHAFGYLVRLAVYSGTKDDRLEAIGKLLNFNLNSPEWIRELGPVMGAPLSKSQVDEVRTSEDPDVQEVVAVTDETLAAESRARFDAPSGSSTWRLELRRAVESVAMGGEDVNAAAQSFHETITGQIG